MKRNDFFEKVWSWKVNPVNLVNLEILVSAQTNLNRLADIESFDLVLKSGWWNLKFGRRT